VMVDDQWVGAELAGYRVDALVGRGGAGVVYRATQLRLQRPAAVKSLAPALAADAEYRRQFEREARLAAGLAHPHIVPIYDAGYAEGTLYMAMAYIDGPNLAAVIENDGPMDLGRVCGLLTGVADALDSAHHAGLVHRDVKPANVLLTGAGGVASDRDRSRPPVKPPMALNAPLRKRGRGAFP
jgi:serine/threonine protein kinase